MKSKRFWIAASERAIKTAAQSLVASGLIGTGLLGLDWRAALSIVAAATVLSLLTSLASAGVGDSSSPSLTDAK